MSSLELLVLCFYNWIISRVASSEHAPAQSAKAIRVRRATQCIFLHHEKSLFIWLINNLKKKYKYLVHVVRPELVSFVDAVAPSDTAIVSRRRPWSLQSREIRRSRRIWRCPTHVSSAGSCASIYAGSSRPRTCRFRSTRCSGAGWSTDRRTIPSSSTIRRSLKWVSLSRPACLSEEGSIGTITSL